MKGDRTVCEETPHSFGPTAVLSKAFQTMLKISYAFSVAVAEYFLIDGIVCHPQLRLHRSGLAYNIPPATASSDGHLDTTAKSRSFDS